MYMSQKAKVWHKIATSSRGLLSSNRAYYMTRNRLLFVKKHVVKIERVKFLGYFFLFEFWINSGIFLIRHKNVEAFTSFIRGLIDGFRKLMKQ